MGCLSKIQITETQYPSIKELSAKEGVVVVHKSKHVLLSSLQYLSSLFIPPPTHYTMQQSTINSLNRDGYAIVPNVLTQEQCARMESLAWEFYEQLSQEWEIPIRRDDPSTWVGIFKLLPKHGMLQQHFGVGHCDMSWYVRQLPEVIGVFERLWQTKQLLVSFDGMSMGLPPETTNRGWWRRGRQSDPDHFDTDEPTWMHMDQAPGRNDCKPGGRPWECIQGWVTARDVNPGDATLSVLVGSHNYQREFEMEFRTGNTKRDWHMLKDPAQMQWFKDRDCTHKNIECPAGSMVLWDSRTVHCGIEPRKSRPQPNTRIVCYVCYTPKKLATKKGLTKKQEAFRKKRTTAHWPHKVKLFSVDPQHYGNGLPNTSKTDDPQMGKRGMELAGF